MVDQLFNNQSFVDYHYFMDKNLYEASMPRHEYFVLNQQEHTLNIYGELDQNEVFHSFSKPYQPFPMHITLNPKQSLLDRYGFSGPRSAIIEFSVAVLKDLPIPLTPKVGDRVNVTEGLTNRSRQYEILTQAYEQFIANTSFPLRFIVAAELVEVAQQG